MDIGIEYHTKLVYEADHNYGHPVWPLPRLLQVKIYPSSEEVLTPSDNHNFSPFDILFREDTYNTTNRVRRGRLYQAGDSMPNQWQVYPHPMRPKEAQEAMNRDGTIQKTVYAFHAFRLESFLKRQEIEEPLLVLGTQSGSSIWSLIDIETSVTGDELVILKSRKSIGALPRLERDKIFEEGGARTLEAIQALEDEYSRGGVVAVINTAGETASAILSAYLTHRKLAETGLKLATLADKAEADKRYIVANAARTLARLHSRTKNMEQENRVIRKVTERDAEYAMQTVGIILCDLGWGDN